MRRIFLLVLAIISIFPTIENSANENEPIILSKGPYLFIDDYLIAEQSFLNRTVNHPIKFPEPIILGGETKDYVWQPYLSVLKDSLTNRFRVWYNTPVEFVGNRRCQIGYMESEDGINWIRPHKILKDPHEIQYGVSIIDRGANHLNSSERFILATYLKPGLRISTSSDGLTWTPISNDPLLLHNHDISSLHWDPIRKWYLAIVSHRIGGFGGETRRIPHQSISKDLINWKKIRPVIFPKNGAPIEKGEMQFYSMSGVITRGDLLIGLVKVLRDDLNATPGKSAKEMGDKKRKAAGLGYTVLAWSRDGITWARDHEIFLPNNPVPNTWDHAMAWGDEQLIVNDETFIYYGGYKRGHKVARYEERQIGLARMAKDRYVSREAGFNVGRLLTKSLKINAEEITINANVLGKCRIRILDENQKPVDGFEWFNLNGDSIAHKVNWSSNLIDIKEKLVSLEFEMVNTQLYGFDLQ